MEEAGIETDNNNNDNNNNKNGNGKGNLTVHAKDSKTQDVLEELASTLGDEWNEEEHEKLMQKLFGEEYYKEDDADEEHIDDGMSERKLESKNKKEGIDGKLEGYLDELYSVDRDAQDVPFKYVEVPKEDFGLSIAEILNVYLMNNFLDMFTLCDNYTWNILTCLHRQVVNSHSATKILYFCSTKPSKLLYLLCKILYALSATSLNFSYD